MDGAIPNVPDSKATGCSGALGLAVFPLTGIPILDGSRSACGWDTDPDAVVPGIFGPAAIPRLIRRDYVENGNDSHWLSNPEEPLTGFDRVIGDEATTRSLRTRLGLVMIEQRIAGTDGLRGEGFGLQGLARVALGNRQYAGELWRDELVAFCEANPTVVGNGRAGRRPRRLPDPRRLGPARRPRLGRRDPLPALRLSAARATSSRCRPASRAATPRARRRSSTSRSTRPIRSTRRAGSTPTTRWSAGRSATRSPISPVPGSRSTARCATSSTTPGAASGSRSAAGPGRSASSTRSTSSGTPSAATPTSPTARASSPR